MWVSLAAGLAMLFSPLTRNSGYFGLTGTAMGALYHYDIGTVPETLTIARLLWAFALFLIASKTFGPTLTRPFAALRRRSA
jgi:hypothetical protein